MFLTDIIAMVFLFVKVVSWFASDVIEDIWGSGPAEAI